MNIMTTTQLKAKPTLDLTPDESPLTFKAAPARMMGTNATGWKLTTKRGKISGVGVSVSGQGAYAELEGDMSFTMRSMQSSKTYNKLVDEYNIGGGVSAFWSWLGISANASKHHEDIQESLKEMSESTEVTGTVHVDLMVTGIYPNVQVDASAYILVMQITDDQGNTTNVFCPGGKADVGAQDDSGQALPTANNQSTITI